MTYHYDLFLFMGQSNMAGRGVTNEKWQQKAPKLIEGAGVEFRAISDPAKLQFIISNRRIMRLERRQVPLQVSM